MIESPTFVVDQASAKNPESIDLRPNLRRQSHCPHALLQLELLWALEMNGDRRRSPIPSSLCYLNMDRGRPSLRFLYMALRAHDFRSTCRWSHSRTRARLGCFAPLQADSRCPSHSRRMFQQAGHMSGALMVAPPSAAQSLDLRLALRESSLQRRGYRRCGCWLSVSSGCRHQRNLDVYLAQAHIRELQRQVPQAKAKSIRL